MNSMPELYATAAQERKKYRYTRSVVAFLDILGFKGLVQNEKNCFLFATAFDMIRSLNSTEESSFATLRGVQVSVMSDSIVISAPCRQSGALSRVLTCVHALMDTLMRHGIFLRGAIAIGNVYHSGNTAFGPAIVDAYQLESNCAVYPRCIMTKETLEAGLKTCHGEASRSTLQRMLHRCQDGFYAYDFFGQYLQLQRCQTADALTSALEMPKTRLQQQLEAGYPAKVHAKFEWLKGELNHAAAAFSLEKRIFIPLPVLS